jgi:hypothetical protein
MLSLESMLDDGPRPTHHRTDRALAARAFGVRRVATLSAGWTLLVTGTVLLVLPGPGLPLLLGGLALLGREVAWAQRLRGRIEDRLPWRRRAAGAPPGGPLGPRGR